jgi:hypothetical protein
MTTCPCPAPSLRRSVVGAVLGMCLTGMAFATAAAPASQIDTNGKFGVVPLSFAQAALHSCRRSPIRDCEPAKARIARIKQDMRQAPHVSVSGLKISWRQVFGVGGYVLARKVPNQSYQYSVIKGTSATPTAVPGNAVQYWVRTEATNSAWSQAVTISYAATTAPQEPPSTPAQVNGSTPSPGNSNLTSAGVNSLAGDSPSENPPLEGILPSRNEPFVKGVSENLNAFGETEAPKVAEEIRGLGAGWARVDLKWKQVMPAPGVYDWSLFDNEVRVAQAHGLHLLPILDYAPSWTQPSNAAGYAEFVAAAVARYGPGTSANIQWFELWNEPYDSYAWSGETPNAEAYGQTATRG